MSFFEEASNMRFSGGQFFTSANTVINNFYDHRALAESEPGMSGPDRQQWLNLPVGKQRFRLIEMCDVNMLREVSVQTVDVLIKPRVLKPTNPFRGQIESRARIVKVKKRTGIAELVQFGDRHFTVVSYEPENERDTEKLRTVLRPLCEFALSSRLVWFTQVFGVGQSTAPTLIYHDELVGAGDIVKQYRKTPIVFQFLLHRINTSYDAVVDAGALQKLSIPFSSDLRDWAFNLRTHSFQYDIASNALSTKYYSPMYFRNRVLSLPPPCNPPLDSSEILLAVPNYLHLISDLACTTNVKNLSDLVRHEVLTFGAVVDRTKPGILRYLPSIPPPEWYWENYSPDIVAKYSQSVPSHVDLTFKNTTDIELKLHFSLRLKSKDRQQLRTAYLSQSLPLYSDAAHSNDLVFVDEFCFCLVGTFTSDPWKSHPPKYLHVPPLIPEWINGMPCLRLTPTTELFYWSSDRSGKERIAEHDWQQYGISNMKLETWIGSVWGSRQPYLAVRDYLRFMDYDLDGKRFATEYGYPILIKDDPHVRAKNCPIRVTTSLLKNTHQTTEEWYCGLGERRSSGKVHRNRRVKSQYRRSDKHLSLIFQSVPKGEIHSPQYYALPSASSKQFSRSVDTTK